MSLNIKTRIKDIAVAAMAVGNFAPTVQRLLSYKSISIFTYHAVIEKPLAFDDWCFLDSKMFDRQMAYLSQNFETVSLSKACQMMEQDKIEKPTAVVTFDDGYLNNAQVVLPIIQRYKIPITIYLATQLIDSNKSVWFSRVHHALACTTKDSVEWQGNFFSLQSNIDKTRCSSWVQTWLKTLHPSDIEQAINDFRTALELDNSVEEVPHDFKMMSAADINLLRQTGLVEFGAHTAEHTILSRLTKDDQQHQISSSIEAVGRLTGDECHHFAYPNGGGSDFNDDSVCILNELGIKSATTMIKGQATADSDRYRLPRYPVGSDTDFARFKLMSHHLI